jgi:hypothetical protein
MRITGIGLTGHMTKALAVAKCEQDMRSDVAELAGEAEALIKSYSEDGIVRTASGETEDALLNQLLLSKLANKFKIKVDLIKRGKKNKSRKAKPKDKEPGLDARTGATDMVSFPAVANNNDPDYVCSVKIHKPQDDIIAVSVYLMETNIGQYAYKNNFFFKPGNEDLAKRCYRRVSLAIKDVREDVASGYNLQHEVPLLITKRLQGEESEVQQEVKQFAVYLDPRNVHKTDAGKHNFPSIRETSSRLKTK